MVKNKEASPVESAVVEAGDPIAQRVRHIVEAALDRKAFDLTVLEVRSLTTLGDYFILCSGNSERQTQAIAEAVETKLREEDGVKPLIIEGAAQGRWILVDYGDFIIHIFTDECRRFYSLERLWGDAPDRTADFGGLPVTAGTDERKRA